MTKTQAFIGFMAVMNYLCWKYSNLICTTIDQECKYFECHMHFDPNELPVESLKSELNKIRGYGSKMSFREVRGQSTMVVELEWWYED